MQTGESQKNSIDIIYHFVDGATVHINGPQNHFLVEFINKKTGKLEFQKEIDSNQSARFDKKYFVDWKIIVKNGGKTIFNYDLDLKNQRVLISLNSKALGDTLAWFPYIEEFRKKHQCKIVCTTFFNEFFEQSYREIEFLKPGSEIPNIFARYQIGCWRNDDKKIFFNWWEQPLQSISAKILGLEYKEIRPKISFNKQDIKIKKLICIGTESTSRCKFWNNIYGWKLLTRWLIKRGYTIVNLSLKGTKLDGVINIFENESLDSIMSYLSDCELFIGLSSGLSWLAWALNKHVVMISGATEPWNEFQSGITRVVPPEKMCRGCLNKFEFDNYDFEFCPEENYFQCTKSILWQQVKDAILPLL